MTGGEDGRGSGEGSRETRDAHDDVAEIGRGAARGD